MRTLWSFAYSQNAFASFTSGAPSARSKMAANTGVQLAPEEFRIFLMRSFILGDHLNVLVVDHVHAREMDDLRLLQGRRDRRLDLVGEASGQCSQFGLARGVLLERKGEKSRRVSSGAPSLSNSWGTVTIDAG